MKRIAHRGLKTKNFKENTLEAMINAEQNNYEGIECDVRITKDNHLILSHDAFFAKGLIRNYTLEELQNIENNHGINGFTSLIDVLKNIKIIKLIELKERFNIESILEYVDDNTYFISFDTAYLLKLKEKYPQLKIGSLNYILNTPKNYNLDIVCLLESVMTKKIENYFLDRGIKIFIYGIGKKVNYITESNNVYYIIDE